MKMQLVFTVCSLLGLLAACQSASETPAAPPTLMPTVPPTSVPTVAMDCPVAPEGTLSLKDEDLGFCLAYPVGVGVVYPPPAGEVCLVAGENADMQCNGAILLINVEPAPGWTVGSVADTVAAGYDCSGERYNLTVANEKAVVVSDCHGQDTTRKVFVIHAGRLYTLTFSDLSERFYSQVITSFGFLR